MIVNINLKLMKYHFDLIGMFQNINLKSSKTT